MLYLIVKWVHVLAAIVGLGTNLTYGVWFARANPSSGSLLISLRTIKVLDDRLANPAYVLSLITGLAMIFLGDWSFTTPWILLSLVLYVILVVVGLFGYTPTLRRQIELAERGDPASAEYAAVARRGQGLGIITGVLVVAIVYLMVAKPELWG